MSEVARISLDTSTMRDYAAYLKQAPEIVRVEMTKAVIEAMGLLLHELKDLDAYTPKGAHGLLRGSMTATLIGSMRGQEVAGKVFSPLSYAVAVELGTKPHFLGEKGIASLQDWVEAKLGLSGKEARSVTFAIRRKIAVKGTKGAHMFSRAFNDKAPQIQSMFAEAVARIRARLMGEK